jgi:hypothetical protein
MYASFRRYRMGAGSMDDAMHLADTEFADRLAEEPGFVDYQVVAAGDDMIVSMTIFEDEEQCLASNDMSAEFVREHLGPFQIERLEVFGARSWSVARPRRSSSRRITEHQWRSGARWPRAAPAGRRPKPGGADRSLTRRTEPTAGRLAATSTDRCQGPGSLDLGLVEA